MGETCMTRKAILNCILDNQIPMMANERNSSWQHQKYRPQKIQ